MPGLYSPGDSLRPLDEQSGKAPEPFRTPWRQDYARLIHSPSFRRLQGKTQVFPGHESDFYRNRLTHSLEVAQIAKSIAIRLNATSPEFRTKQNKIEPDIVEFAGLAHDLGHPPFGHNGEEALDECMRDHGGFEGNAQSLRIVTRLEKKIRSALGESSAFDEEFNDQRYGLNLTYRSLAALLKYDTPIPLRAGDRRKPGVGKGYYFEDRELVQNIKESVLGTSSYTGEFKTIECSIMDIADDIAYSTYDLEDNFKAGFLTPMGLFALDQDIYASVAQTIIERARKQYSEKEVFFKKIDANFVRRALLEVFQELLFAPTEESIRLRGKLDELQGRVVVASEIQALSRRLIQDGHQRTKFTSGACAKFLVGH